MPSQLWNAARYVLMNTENIDQGDVELSAADRWIRARFEATVESVHNHFAAYRLDLVSQAIYEFTWHEFCDWYLELSKPVLQSDDTSAAQKRGTQRTLIDTLEALLKLLHPLMPFITEEIWQQVAPRAGIDAPTIMRQPFPETSSEADDPAAVADIDWVREFILGIRQIRGEMDISPGKQLPVILQHASTEDLRRADAHAALLKRVGRVASIGILDEAEEPPASAMALLGDMQMLVPMKGLIDVDAERARLEKQRVKIDADLARTRGKLGNDKFVSNAPAEVVSQERERAAEFEKQLGQLAEQTKKLDKLG